ncbi:unnamed protein product [Lasius platythorax]|uniref:AB hydrolase-1 domain-containing protein n=2 Tax=Lasius platythorax TaxID=488582 RepID=A0AAV2N781_9HYME
MGEIEHKEIKLTVPWGHIAAKTYGPSNGERVLLVHGHLDNAGSYDRLMKYLPINFFYYVCVDLPGHGWSSHFPSGIMLDGMDYAHTIHFILEALQWKTCIYIGHSMGAQIGLIFSVFQPHRIKKIIVMDAFIVYRDDAPNIITHLQDASAFSIKASNKTEPVSYTKEEILYAFKSLRFAPLNSEAADALFERAVTEVNGKYIYNRDIRLKDNYFMFTNLEMANEINRRLSVPIYVLAVSKGYISKYKNAFASAVKIINSETKLEIIDIEGNHDLHNNNPERVAPFIRKILTNSNSSKL